MSSSLSRWSCWSSFLNRNLYILMASACMLQQVNNLASDQSSVQLTIDGAFTCCVRWREKVLVLSRFGLTQSVAGYSYTFRCDATQYLMLSSFGWRALCSLTCWMGRRKAVFCVPIVVTCCPWQSGGEWCKEVVESPRHDDIVVYRQIHFHHCHPYSSTCINT